MKHGVAGAGVNALLTGCMYMDQKGASCFPDI